MKKQKKNKLEEQIDLYETFIKEKRIVESQIPFYREKIKESKRILKLLQNNKMTPDKFSKLHFHDKWTVSRMLNDVTWMCDKCKSFQGTNPPIAPVMDGVMVVCSICNNILTKRTSGGQSNPFNYTFKKNK